MHIVMCLAGRYAAGGILRERFIPRLRSADPEALCSDDGQNLDPHKCWNVIMQGEKPGGHGERSVACGVLDMALWDAVAKIEKKPLKTVLAERYGCQMVDGTFAKTPREKVWVYAAGGYYQPDKDLDKLKAEMKGLSSDPMPACHICFAPAASCCHYLSEAICPRCAARRIPRSRLQNRQNEDWRCVT
eukprot:SAG31_NODE_4626_length_3087_cov_4.080991_4_plen_188_part_00